MIPCRSAIFKPHLISWTPRPATMSSRFASIRTAPAGVNSKAITSCVLLDQRLSETAVKDLGNQIASSANTTMSKDRPIVSVSIAYKDRPIRAQVITPPAVMSAMSISMRFFSSLSLEKIELSFLFGKERKLEEVRQEKTQELRAVVASGVIDDALAFCVENRLNMIVSGGTSTGKTVAARKIFLMSARKSGSSRSRRLPSFCPRNQTW